MKRYLPLGKGMIVTSPYGPRSGGFHYGTDFGFPGGSGYRPVYAIQSGTVIHAGAAQGYGGPDPAGWLVIDSTDEEGGGCLEYGHIIRRCNKGDHVKAGQIIAEINPHSATNGGVAPHLHLSDMPGGYDPNTKQDPMKRLQGAIDPTTEPPNPERAPVVLRPITPENDMGVQGDPVWLEDVLRPALGNRLKTLPGWKESGVGGTMGNIWGVIWHHTGHAGATAQSIRNGRPDLPGPLSQLHIAQDGTVTIVAVGPCNHAGLGSWHGLPTDGANTRTIGIECAYPKDVNNPKERWPDAQIIAMRDTGAALTKHLGVDVSHNISHYEWAQRGPAGIRQGKTDPWNLDMNWFRGEIAKDMRGDFDRPTPVTPPPVKVFPQGYTDRELLEYIAAQLGPWPQLGKNDKGQNLTLIDWAAKHGNVPDAQ